MDVWWESLDKVYGVWVQAIDEVDLIWKYCFVEDGEWNIFYGDIFDENVYDVFLFWDYFDIGIDKIWFKNDLFNVLEVVIVFDCFFDGCFYCGVCGVDFGYNIIVLVFFILVFDGDFKFNINWVQCLRVWFGK